MEHEYRPAEAGSISPELLFITVYKLDRYHVTLLFFLSALQRVATANSQFQFVGLWGLPLWGRGFVNSAEMPTARKTTRRGYPFLLDMDRQRCSATSASIHFFN